MWAEKKEPGTHSSHAQFPQDFREFENFHKSLLHYTNFHDRCLPLTTLYVDDDKGAKKTLSSSFAGIAFVHSS